MAEKEEPTGVAAAVDLNFVIYDQAVKFHGMMMSVRMLSDRQWVDKCDHVVPFSQQLDFQMEAYENDDAESDIQSLK